MIKPVLRTILVLLVGLLVTSTMQAQDIHYSQFTQSPMSLNPSLTGHMPAKFRINGMYRDQWPQIPVGGTTFRTYMVGFDANLLRTKNQYNSLGLGIHIMNDESGAGKLNTTEIMLSGAYHFDLQENMKYYLSAGLQAGVMNKRLDLNKIIFGDQVDENTGDISDTTLEAFENTSIFIPDVRFGLTFAGFPSNTTRYKIGVGLFHLLQPSEKFLEATDENKLPLRIAAHADGRFGSRRLGIEPRVLFQTQAAAMELVPGLLFDIKIVEKASLYLGGEIRLDGSVDKGIATDAGIAVIGLRILDWDVGVSYDFNTSDLQNVTNGQGGRNFIIKNIQTSI